MMAICAECGFSIEADFEGPEDVERFLELHRETFQHAAGELTMQVRALGDSIVAEAKGFRGRIARWYWNRRR